MSELFQVIGQHPIVAGVMGAMALIFIVVIVLLNGSVKIGPVTVGGRKFTEDSLAAENRILRSLNTRKADIAARIQLMRQMAVTDEAVDELVGSMADLFRQFTGQQNRTGHILANDIADNEAVLREQAKVVRNLAKVYHRQNGYAHMEKHEFAAYVDKRCSSMETALTNCRMDIAFDKAYVGTAFIDWREKQEIGFRDAIEAMFLRCSEIAHECEEMSALLQAEYHRIEVEFSKTGKVLEPDQKCFEFDKY